MNVMQLVLIVALGAGMSATMAADVYKVVDSEGNVTYTDEPPASGGELVDLPGLSIVDTPETVRRDPAPQNEGVDEAEQLNDLRRRYTGFEISRPEHDETLWGTGNSMVVGLNSPRPLAAGMQYVYYVDGVEVARGVASTLQLSEVDRGSHRLQAEIQDGNERVIARSEEITVHMKQFSRQFNN